ncbi:antA/AntB antirepressor family protein [Citrobacter telavivensis]
MKLEKSRFTSEAVPQSNVGQGVIINNDFAAIVPVNSGLIGGRQTNIVSAKALHKALGVGRVFSSWFNARVDEYGFASAADFIDFDSPVLGNQSSYIDQLTPERVFSPKRGRPEKDYLISLNMAKELAMVERNEQGRAVRRYFIQCEEELQRSVPEIAARYRQHLKARINAAGRFTAMCEALELARMEQGKTTQRHHYTNESNMLSRIVLGGLTAKQWAQANGVEGEPRDSMNAEQLEHFAYLENTNITLIDMGMEFEQRKAELNRLSQRWMAKHQEVAHD